MMSADKDKDKWSADEYVKFLDERTQPSRDLLARIPLTSPKFVVDLGCGPGNSTAVVAQRYPNATVSGIDSSPDMIRKALGSNLPGVDFRVAELQTYEPDQSVDLYFSNAVFQWVPAADRLPILKRLLSQLSPAGGVLAFQIPFNMSEPSHVAMRETASEPDAPWTETLRRADTARDEFHSPAELYDALKPLCSRVDIWKTTYFHLMENHEGIVDWVKGTGLRPFLDPLSDSEREAYTKRYLERIREAYTAQQDGRVLLPYPRLFVVASKA